MSEEQVFLLLQSFVHDVFRHLAPASRKVEEACWWYVEKVDYDPDLIDMAAVIRRVVAGRRQYVA